MIINFSKYHGTGNDFIIIDNRNGEYDNLNREEIKFLCHRRFGVGADGVILFNNQNGYDFEMKYYNADGRESSMCGNGGRCLVKFAHDVGVRKTSYKFVAIDGAHEASIDSDGIISLKMKDVENITKSGKHFILDTGSPHFVELTNNVMHMDVCKAGRAIRYRPEFKKEGINVNFVEQLEEPDKIIVRTYERGVEDETLSCGTGVTAAAIVCHHNDNGFNCVDVQTKGGRLSVQFDKKMNFYTNIWLNGPATKVFEGTINISV